MTQRAGRWPRGGPAGVAGGEPVREPRDAVLEDGRATGPVDRAVDSPAAAHPVVGGVDDGVDVLLR